MMRDDFDDFIDRIKKYFKLDSDIFDIDFLFVPESDKNLNKILKDENIKGFKISYHYDSGMDKPEIKVEGNIDDKRIREYLRNIDVSKIPQLKDLYKSKTNNTQEIDASTLSLDTSLQKEEKYQKNPKEPYTEICDKDGFTEIMIEIPGMERDNVSIKFEDKGKMIIFTARDEQRKYMKTIPLLFKSSERECEIEVNNGIALLKVGKIVT
jgi:HSP20 family molecular chaperone IbpA